MKSGLGTPTKANKYDNVTDYLNDYLFKTKDVLFELQADELAKRKEYNKAQARVSLQKQKLDTAYSGLEAFRKWEK